MSGNNSSQDLKTVTAVKTAVFKLHNPTLRKHAMLDDALLYEGARSCGATGQDFGRKVAYRHDHMRSAGSHSPDYLNFDGVTSAGTWPVGRTAWGSPGVNSD